MVSLISTTAAFPDVCMVVVLHGKVCMVSLFTYSQRRVQPDQCYFTVQITGSNFSAVCSVIQQS